MRAAMAAAPVGDDVYGEDPSVAALEARMAELTGKEAAVFTPSGTMANQLGVRVWAGAGDEVYLHREAHLMINEAGGIAALWGAQPRVLGGRDGRIDLDELRYFVPEDRTDVHLPVPRLVCAENTHMASGGRIYPAAELRELGETARRLGLRLHLDGARLANAAVASGVGLAEVAVPADTVQVCLSKGLGAPVGSILCGPADAIVRARRFRKLLGGGMRQAGVIAAAALYAVENHLERLAEDHRRARVLAAALAECGRVDTDPANVETNIVLARLRSERDRPDAVLAELAGHGLLAGPLDARTLRFVTHLDLDDEGLERACHAVRAALGRLVE
jgi:threonine aldolase